MKNKMKILTVAAIACLAFGTMQVSAADDRVGTIIDGSILTNEDFAESYVSPLKRGTILNNGTGTIYNSSGRTVAVGGTTTANYKVDRVQVNLFVQKLNGSTWVNAVTVPSKTLYNAYYVSQSKNYTVSGGYYYRVKGAHIAVDGDIYESTASATDGIWIN